jgi:hypothetical protein
MDATPEQDDASDRVAGSAASAPVTGGWGKDLQQGGMGARAPGPDPPIGEPGQAPPPDPGDVEGNEAPIGIGANSPLNQGSEDTAVPPVDPAESRLDSEQEIPLQED